MTQIVVSIPDKKVKAFLDFINDLSYINVEDKDFSIPDWQRREVRIRVKSIKANPAKLISSKEAFAHLKSLRV